EQLTYRHHHKEEDEEVVLRRVSEEKANTKSTRGEQSDQHGSDQERNPHAVHGVDSICRKYLEQKSEDDNGTFKIRNERCQRVGIELHRGNVIEGIIHEVTGHHGENDE